MATNSDTPSGADIIEQFRRASGGTAATPAAPLDTDAAAPTTGADIIQRFKDAADASAQSAATAAPEPSFGQKVAAGVQRGLRETVVDPAERFVQWSGIASGLRGLGFTGVKTPEDVQTDIAAGNEAYAPYAGSTVANVARLGTEAFTTTAPLLAGGNLLALGARGVGAAIPEIAPVIDWGTNLLSGSLRGESMLGNLAARTGSLATQGAALGAGAGAITSGDQPVGQAALEGAATGAALGPVLGAAGAIGSAFLRPLLARIPGVAERQAATQILTALQRDQITPADAQAALQRLGPEAAVIDVGGANVRRLGEAIANKPGAGAQTAETFLEGRAAGQQSRINTAIRTATGSQADFYDALSDLTQQRSQAAAPLYKQAFDSTIVAPQDAAALERFVTDPIGQQGLQRGMRTLELEAKAADQPFNPADYGVTQDADGKWILASGTPNLRLFDAVKRGMDSITEQYRNPTTGLMDFAKYDDNFGSGRAVDNLRKSYVAELRSRFPDYADALDAWSGPSKAIDALNMGRRVLGQDPEVSAKAISNLSDNEKEFFKAGVARALKDRVEGVQDSADATRRIFGNQLIRDKIAAAFGDPAAFDKFQRTMEAEAQFAKTRNEVLKGSPTARRLAAQSELDVVTPTVMAAHGHPVGAALHVGQQVAGNALAQGSPVQAAMARRLFAPGQPGADYLSALQRRNPLFEGLSPAARAALVAGVVSGRNSPPQPYNALEWYGP